MSQSFYERHGKRWFDLILSSVGLVVLSPLLLLCALLIKISSPGPVFFRQLRTGLDGRQFRIFKFRTMFNRQSSHTSFLTAAGDSRVTSVGRSLRRTKIDELPQLFNVISGDMSLVGPRPEVPLYTDRYTPAQRRVLSVKPGITGLASICFSAEEKLLAAQNDKEHFYLTALMPCKVEMDIQYCRRITFLGDLDLLLKTVLKLLGRSKPLMIPAQDATGAPN